ncbi:MAG: hypothetical protein ACF8XB_10740 [Planctomycetota bacterium JB042]
MGRADRIHRDITPEGGDTVTTDISAWQSQPIDTRDLEVLRIQPIFGWSDATSITVQIQVEDEDGAAWHTVVRRNPVTGAPALDSLVFTTTDYSPLSRLSMLIDVRAATRVRFRAFKTGGSGDPTLNLLVLGEGD